MRNRLRALLLAAIFLLAGCQPKTNATPAAREAPSSTPTNLPSRAANPLPIAENPLRESVISAGDYLARQQLPNGELSYQVQFFTGEREYSPSHVRLVGGIGALFTACRVSGDESHCRAGDLALSHYLELLVSQPKAFKGTCLYAEGNCQLGGAALMVDAIYKRWLATNSVFLNERDLLNTAAELGYFIVSMQKPEGGFYHAFDPHIGGTADAAYFVPSASGQSLLALLDLYEMTGNPFWLEQARRVNNFMITQPVTEDQWHCYALAKFARLDSLTEDDLVYAKRIANTVIAGEVRSLNPKNTSISSAAKIEALAALAQAFSLAGESYAAIDVEIRTFATFVQARQLPNQNCGWELTDIKVKNFTGGVFSTCEDPSIRVDAQQNWINGITTYLEYLQMQK